MKTQNTNATNEEEYRANPAVIPETLLLHRLQSLTAIMVNTDGHFDEICSPLRRAAQLVCEGITVMNCLKGEGFL